MKKAVEIVEEETVTMEDLKEYIKSDEFKKSIELAHPEKAHIITDLIPEYKDIREEFVDYMINASKSLDGFDEKEFKKEFRSIYNTIISFKLNPDKAVNLASSIALLIKYFDFINDDILKSALETSGIYLDDKKTGTLKEMYPDINEETNENLKAIIEDGVNCKETIKATNEKITGEIYEENIPEDLKYSKDNKIGLKKSSFNKLVSAELIKTIKNDNKKIEKYFNNLTEKSLFSAAREELIQEGIETIKNID